MHGDEGFAQKFGDPITELIVTHRDKDFLLEVEGVAYVKYRATFIAMLR